MSENTMNKMNTKELKNKIARQVCVSSNERDLAYQIFIEKLNYSLLEDKALKVPDIGVFQLGRGDQTSDKAHKIIYYPIQKSAGETASSLFLIIEAPRKSDSHDFDESAFDLSLDKPLMPFSGEEKEMTEPGAQNKNLRKSIEERVQEIIGDSEYLVDFDLQKLYYEMSKEAEGESEEETGTIEETEQKESSDDELESLGMLGEIEESETEEKEETSEQFEEEEFEETGKPGETQTEEPASGQSEGKDEPEWDWGEELQEEFTESEDSADLEDEDADELFKKLDESLHEDDLPEDEETLEHTEGGDESKEKKDFAGFMEDESEDREEESESLGNSRETEDKDTEEPYLSLQNEEDDFEPKIPDKKEDEEEEDEKDYEERFGSRDRSNKSFFIILGAAAILIVGLYYIFIDDDDEIKTEIPKEPAEEVQQSSPDVDEKITAKIDSEKTKSLADAQSQKKKEQQPADKKTSENKNDEIYRDFTKERQVNDHVFKVNEGFILQASSWPAKSKAEREVKRLRDFGYDAFITKAYIEKYGATWYRVRIGYFDSLQQAEKFEKQNKKKLEGKT